MNDFEPETIEEHVYGEVLADRILEAKRDGLVQDTAEDDLCEFGHKKYQRDECPTCEN